MDDIDRAQDHIERTEAAHLAMARIKRGDRELTPSGQCHYCQQFVSAAQLFCDSDCADDFAKEKARRLTSR